MVALVPHSLTRCPPRAASICCCCQHDADGEMPCKEQQPSSRIRRSLFTAAVLSASATPLSASALTPPRPGIIGRKVKRVAEEVADELREQVLLSQLGNTPARYASGRPVRANTAEEFLLSGLPIKCPPLDLLQLEIEKFFVLRPAVAPLPPPTDPPKALNNLTFAERPTTAAVPSPPPPPPAPPRSPPPLASSAPIDWSTLETARSGALSATVDSRPLFRLFLDRTDVKRGNSLLDSLASQLRALDIPLKAKDPGSVLAIQTEMLRTLVTLGNLVVPSFPYPVSKAIYCEGLPRLLGRATVEMVVDRPSTALESNEGFPLKFCIMVDGYAAPISSGNFIDLVQRGFYNGLPIGRQGKRLPKSVEESGLILTTGQPADLATASGSATGFIDPRTGSLRSLPVEVLPAGAPEPLYRPGTSMSQKPALPFRACGSIGMVHSLGNPDDASSEIFLTTAELPDGAAGARLTNQLDGVFTLFGFVLEGREDLGRICVGDMVTYMKVTSGAELVSRPSFNPSYQTRKRDSSMIRDYQMLGGEGLGEYDGGVIPSTVPLADEEKLKRQAAAGGFVDTQDK